MTRNVVDVRAGVEAVPPEHFDEETVVPGAGPQDASLMIVGEAPAPGGRTKEPFVCNAGRRLDTAEGSTAPRGRTFERDGRLVVPTVPPAVTFYDESERDAIVADRETAAEALEGRR